MQWRRLLWPFSLIYDSITRIRNTAFDQGILASRSFDLPVIAVGNLSTGGTGKTPMVEFLLDRLKSYKRAVVSRGYGRKASGLLIANPQHTAAQIGDEPLQMYRKFPDIQMVLSEKRVLGLEALQENPPEVVILDDAFQHRYVKPGFQVLLTTFQDPFFKDFVLPAGNLRESSRGKERADVILVTKCPPDMNTGTADLYRSRIRPRKDQAVFFTSLEYGEPVNAHGITLPHGADVLAITGIASPQPFTDHLSKGFTVAKHLNFEDHHHFSEADIRQIETYLEQHPECPVITTEKDLVRLLPLLSDKLKPRIFSLPIRVRFLFEEENTFMQRITGFISGSPV
ncbi:MAG TPA: tetraacyldisaccharide 4'-kinase [Cryomorphaceae bacterium]|nr:tetraacyldisaccharide 4'-kinase [Owenweeksia sp.]HAD97017.1 tetraacyldisaccharide 4'-kinase [Cryomorphaceae bacterium]|tara:strand:- start:2586 stop:3608 length:1023 start_codon:yes stop_codon:yes gene_type:complete